jgi:REP element-mobilizing transposase RayT
MGLKVLFHITQVTHCSRISKRMDRLKILPRNPVRLTLEEEIELARIITKIVKKHKYIIFAYNSCSDHIHFVIFCEAHKLKNIIMRIKIITSSKYKEKKGITLWAQKFNRKPIDTIDGLANVINYIQNNRMKHELPENDELQMEIQKMLTSFEDYSW